MKSLVVSYSYSGNTKKVAEILSAYLRQNGEVQMLELAAEDESGTFLGQCRRAFWHQRARIVPVESDLSAYDIIAIGTPVWAFGPTPAVNAYLDACSGLAGKTVLLFTTYGGGAGNQRCLNYMQDILTAKGALRFARFSIQQLKVGDKEYVLEQILKATRLWPNG